MKLASLFYMSLGSLGSNKLRSLLALLGIVIGITAVIALMSIGKGVQKLIIDELEGIGTNLVFLIPAEPEKKDDPWKLLTLSDVDSLKNNANTTAILDVAAEKNWQGKSIKGDKSINGNVIGVTEGYDFVRNIELQSGIFINEFHLEQTNQVVVIGSEVKDRLFEDDNPIGSKIRIKDSRFTVIGVVQEQDKSSWGDNPNKVSYIPITTMFQTLSPNYSIDGQKEIDWIMVKATSYDTVTKAMAETAKVIRLEHRLIDEDDDFVLTNQQEILKSLEIALAAIVFFLVSIAAISLIVGGIGIMNIMLVSVTERTREIGIRKALGAKRSDILVQFVIEAVLLTCSGGFIGIALGYLSSLALDGIPIGEGQLETSFGIDIALIAISVSTVIGLFFGIFPAFRASKLHPIEALRFQ